MAHGGDFGADAIRYFNGNLFNDGAVLDLTPQEIEAVRQAADLDWGAVDPSILGTLFERGLDPKNRTQLGAHYTSRQDIETLIEPVVLAPLRREWDEVRTSVETTLKRDTPVARRQADQRLQGFVARLGQVRVLDPAWLGQLPLRDVAEAQGFGEAGYRLRALPELHGVFAEEGHGSSTDWN